MRHRKKQPKAHSLILVPKLPTEVEKLQQQLIAAGIALRDVCLGYADPEHKTFIIFIRFNEPKYMFDAIFNKLAKLFTNNSKVTIHPEPFDSTVAYDKFGITLVM
jgi:hypothetical protein